MPFPRELNLKHCNLGFEGAMVALRWTQPSTEEQGYDVDSSVFYRLYANFTNSTVNRTAQNWTHNVTLWNETANRSYVGDML